MTEAAEAVNAQIKNPMKGMDADAKRRNFTPDQMQLIKDFMEKSKSDFSNFYSPSDDPYGTIKMGGKTDGRPSLTDLQALTERRIGVAWRICRIPANDAIRNQFYFINIDDKSESPKEVPKPEIEKWMRDVDWWNQLANVLYYERTYGVGFLVKFYGLRTPEEKTSKKEDLETEAPKGAKPVKLQAVPPTYLAPTNTYQSRYIDQDEDLWEFQGGVLNQSKIHPSRVEIFITRPVAGQWRGISALEPMYLSLNSYYNIIIYLTKGISKWGNTVPILKMGNSETNKDAFDDWLALMIQFQMNYFYLIGKDDDLSFVNAQLGAGITEYTEFLKEDISSGSTMPLNILFGRSVAGGIGGEGALTSERYYWNGIANIQISISDNCYNILSKIFPLENDKIAWNLAQQKTKEQRLREENMIIQNDTMKAQLKTIKLNNKISELQYKFMKENPGGLPTAEPTEGEPTESTESPEKTAAEKIDFLEDLKRKVQIINDFSTKALENNRKNFPKEKSENNES